MKQEVVLAMLAKEPSYGYELRGRLRQALGPLGDAMNDGQIYVTLTRLETAGQVVSERAGSADRPADRLISMRDGVFVDESRLTGGTSGRLGELVGLEG